MWNLQGALTLGFACLGLQTYLMKSILPVSVFFLAAAFVVAVQPPVRAEGPLGSWSGAWLENDLVVNTDRHYTHGTLFSHLFHEHVDGDGSGPDRVASHLPAMGLLGGFSRWGVSLGQNIYTPDDIRATGLVVNDRPYAGYLYTSWHLIRRGDLGYDKRSMQDSWTLDLGIVGPGSGAEQAQNTVHRMRRFEEALGWGNQLQNEPAVNLKYARVFRYSSGTPGGWEAQFLPHYGASLGTIFTVAAAGAQVRGGWNLPENFGHRNIGDLLPSTGGRSGRETSHWSALFFATMEGRAVAWNMLLDGNLYHDSHSVDKQLVVGEFKGGATIAYRAVSLTLMQVVRSNEYDNQPSFDTYGSLSLGVSW